MLRDDDDAPKQGFPFLVCTFFFQEKKKDKTTDSLTHLNSINPIVPRGRMRTGVSKLKICFVDVMVLLPLAVALRVPPGLVQSVHVQ